MDFGSVDLNLNPFNRPSVIVFNPLSVQHRQQQQNNTPGEEEGGDSQDIQIIYDSRESNQNLNNTNENINYSQQNQLENNNNSFEFANSQEASDSFPNLDEFENEIETGREGEDINFADYYNLNNHTTQQSRLAGILYTHYKSVIDPSVYHHHNSDNFFDTFTKVYQSIFNSVLEKVETDFPNTFGYVKLSLKIVTDPDRREERDSGIYVNLDFLPIDELSSEVFLIELYKFLQSKREILTTSETDLSFTFLPKKSEVRTWLSMNKHYKRNLRSSGEASGTASTRRRRNRL
jgi:hypothetical protein